MTSRVSARRTQPVLLAGLAAAAVVSAGVTTGSLVMGYDSLVGTALLAGLVVVTWPILLALGRHEPRRVRNILVAALAVKIVGSIARIVVTLEIYGPSDAKVYHRFGQDLAAAWHSGQAGPHLDGFVGTEFIRLLTGALYYVFGPSRLGGFAFYAWLGFLGLLLWFAAFRLAVPDGNRWAYAGLIFFLPSLAYWPSSIGKEAWMMLAVGLAAYGVAKGLKVRLAAGLLPLAAGLALASLVRPHVAVLIALSATVAYMIHREPPGTHPSAYVAKAMGAAVMIALTVFFVVNSQAFFRLDSVDTESVTDLLQRTQERSTQGGAAFESIVVRSPADVPAAVVTVLFRPFLFEVEGWSGILSAVEAMFILGLVLYRFRSVSRAVRLIRWEPYLAFALCYTLAYCLAFASLGNFAILARQRVLMLPALLALLALPARPRLAEPEPAHARI